MSQGFSGTSFKMSKVLVVGGTAVVEVAVVFYWQKLTGPELTSLKESDTHRLSPHQKPLRGLTSRLSIFVES